VAVRHIIERHNRAVDTSNGSFNGKPQATARVGKTVACGLPLNDQMGHS
jgi:hypothetical protein